MGIGVNIVYLGTAEFAVPTLQQLFEAGYPIRAVVTQPDKPAGRGQMVQASPVKRKAQSLQLSVQQPETLKNDTARTLFHTLQPDLIIVVAYGKIIPPWLLALPKHGAINLHGSLLPKYRGAAPVHWAIANGETETGVCTMQVDEGLDTGPVYLCEQTSIGANETVQQLSEKLATIGSRLMLKTLDGVLNAGLKPVAQHHERATYAPILKKEHGRIDWTMPADTIHNRVRAFTPWPGAIVRFRGSNCKIVKSRVIHQPSSGAPGDIIASKHALAVVCGNGTTLEILELQPENRKPVSGTAFANGAHIAAGEKFESLGDNER